MSSQETQRIGIVTVSLDLLEQLMQFPPGARVLDARSKHGGLNRQFEILVEGYDIPETPLGDATPHLSCTMTVTAPKVEFHLLSKSEAV